MSHMSTSPSAAPRRLTSAERRAQVLAAASREFADHGYQAASTSSIAERAGISQPYIYALFPNKKELFLAVQREVTARIRATFLAAADGAPDPQEALRRMGHAYKQLIADRTDLLCQLQGYASAGDPDIQPAVGRSFTDLFDEVARVTGAPQEEVMAFFAMGMLCNVTMALDLPAPYRPELTEVASSVT